MSNVIDFSQVKKKQQIDIELSGPHRTPLYVTHTTGKVTGSQFGDSVHRIRASLAKIDSLIAELKALETEQQGRRV